MSDQRIAELLDAALEIAKNSHYQLVDFDDLAKRAGVSKQLVKYYFHNKENLQAAILERAIELENTVVIDQGERLGKIV